MADTGTENLPDERADLDLNENELQAVAEFVVQEYERRKGRRDQEEKRWKEIDRQLNMEPEARMDARNGKPIDQSNWMPNLELHIQAQAHEALTADARRLLFPPDRSWFTAHALLTDKYLEAAQDFNFIPGDENDIPSNVDQEAADVIVESAIHHWHGMYPFRAHIDQIMGQTFSYGVGVARARMMRLSKYTSDYRGGGVADGRLIPAIVPRSIRSVYLDDNPAAVMREGFIVAPFQIEFSKLRLADLKMAAARGSTSPKNERGGWKREKLFAIEDDPIKPTIDVLDFEGDLMVPVSQGGSMYVPNVVGRVVFNRGGPWVIRLAKREFPFNSYILFPYHRLFSDSPYATSPIIMGAPLHKAATDGLNRLLATAALQVQPPVKYDPNDQWLMARGGPVIEPGAQWPTQSDIDVAEVGDMVGMLQMVGLLMGGHEDVSGVNKPRLGAQTKSHQTAFAVDSEIGRGLVRTVDFINDVMDNPIQSMLHMEYAMCKKAFTAKPEPVFCHRWRMWMNLASSVLPERAVFDTHGSAGPQEEREATQKKLAAIQMFLQTEVMAQQLGATPANLDTIRRMILKDGGFADVDQFFHTPMVAGAGAGRPAGAGAPAGGPGGATAAVPAQGDAADRIIAMATGQPAR